MNPSNQTAPVSSNYRWVICALLFFATTFNYLDRQVISYLKEFFCTPADQGGFGLVQYRLCEFNFRFHGLLCRNDRPGRLGH